MDALMTDCESITRELCSVHIKKADAWKCSDRDAIFAAIRSTIGFNDANSLVVGAVRDWTTSTGWEVLARFDESDPRKLTFQGQLASMLRNQGKLSEAEALYRDALEACVVFCVTATLTR